MPYFVTGNCIFNKDTGKKVGCTKGDVKKYLRALYANVPDAKKQEIKQKLKEAFQKSYSDVLNETIELKKENTTLKNELNKNIGLEFTDFEIKKATEACGQSVNKEDFGRGTELSFQKEIENNNFYFVIKKLVNQADSSKSSYKYAIWYIVFKNEDDLVKPTTVYYRISDPVKALVDDKTDVSKKAMIESTLYNFIKKSMLINT